MSNRLLPVLFASMAACFANSASAAITGARATPRQAMLAGSGNNVVSINWQVSTTSDHLSGVTSATSSLIDPRSGTTLQSTRVNLSASGSGPFRLREVLTLDAATVRSWTEQGLRRVVVERTFADAATGSFQSASAVLSLSPSRLQAARNAAPAQLSIVSLRLELASGNNTTVANLDEPLRAALTVQYTGSGILKGRWQIAEPESSQGMPSFRTLALVNKNLQASQRGTLQSPMLPTARGGKYLVRFCVSSRDAFDVANDGQCSNVDLVAAATYFVEARVDDDAAEIGNLSPDRQAVSASSLFSWAPVARAVVYRLQIFELAPTDADRSTSPGGSSRVEPKFVTGMLLDARTSNTSLSELTRSRLRAGQRYLWRVTAHDDAGRSIGASSEASFIYRPDE